MNAVDSMQRFKCILSECSGVHEAWGNVSRVNAVDSMQHGEMDTD